VTDISKFYVHRTATSDTGTLPAAGASVSATTPRVILDGTNYSMDATIGAGAETSKVLTTIADTAAQASLLVRFLSDPIAAQTIAAQTVTFDLSRVESNANSNFACLAVIAVWRPTGGSVVGRIADLALNLGLNSSTTKAAGSASQTSTSVTAANGDILVLEVWRDATVQAMATAYTNSYFYDGTTESSITSEASFISFTTPITMSGGGAPAEQPVHRNPMVQLLAH
jgi:hypothetical protein